MVEYLKVGFESPKLVWALYTEVKFCKSVYTIGVINLWYKYFAPSSNGKDKRFSFSKSEFDSPWGDQEVEPLCTRLPRVPTKVES
mgnify:CR=1 FL=1